MNTRISLHLVLILAVSIAFQFQADASEQTPTHSFSEKYDVNGVDLQLRGTATKRYFFLKAFESALYLPQNVQSFDSMDDVAKKIKVKYFVPISAKKLNDFTVKYMRKNTSKKEFALLEEEIDKMHKYFVDLKPDDYYALVYAPGQGTSFEYNGEVQGIIPGELFSKALFSVWIGETPFDENLKEKMFGVSSQQAKIRSNNPMNL